MYTSLKTMKAGSVLLFTTGKTSSTGCTQFAKHIIHWIENGIYNIPYEDERKQHEMECLYEYISYQLGEEPSDVYLDLFYMPYLSGLFTTNISKIIEYQEYTKLNNYNKKDKSLPKLAV